VGGLRVVLEIDQRGEPVVHSAIPHLEVEGLQPRLLLRFRHVVGDVLVREIRVAEARKNLNPKERERERKKRIKERDKKKKKKTKKQKKKAKNKNNAMHMQEAAATPAGPW
jgi:hypothetical protein